MGTGLLTKYAEPHPCLDGWERPGLHTYISGHFGRIQAVEFEDQVAQVAQVRVGDLANRQDVKFFILYAEPIAGFNVLIKVFPIMDDGELFQFFRRVLPKEDQHPCADEFIDQRPDLCDLSLIFNHGRHSISSTSSLRTPETNKSAVMKRIRGPEGEVG